MLKFENLSIGDKFTADINFETYDKEIKELTYQGKSETGLNIGQTDNGERLGFYDCDIIDFTHVEKTNYEM
jgi:hypothetical protein